MELRVKFGSGELDRTLFGQGINSEGVRRDFVVNCPPRETSPDKTFQIEKLFRALSRTLVEENVRAPAYLRSAQPFDFPAPGARHPVSIRAPEHLIDTRQRRVNVAVLDPHSARRGPLSSSDMPVSRNQASARDHIRAPASPAFALACLWRRVRPCRMRAPLRGGWYLPLAGIMATRGKVKPSLRAPRGVARQIWLGRARPHPLWSGHQQ